MRSFTHARTFELGLGEIMSSKETITWVSDVLMKASFGICAALLFFAQSYLSEMSSDIKQLNLSVTELVVKTRLAEQTIQGLSGRMDQIEQKKAERLTDLQKQLTDTRNLLLRVRVSVDQVRSKNGMEPTEFDIKR